VVYDAFGSYNVAWIVSLFASLGGVVAIFTMESTKNELIPDWEDDLPEDAKMPDLAPAPADD